MPKTKKIELNPERGWTERFIKLTESPEIQEIISMANELTGAIGYTEHGHRHANKVAKYAGDVLYDLDYPPQEIELARVAGYLHDIGNMISRNMHPETAAVLTFNLLKDFKFTVRERGIIASAIANHDEQNGKPINAISAALILADKSDVHRSRVRQDSDISNDIHDKVNFAVVESTLEVYPRTRIIKLRLMVDPVYASVMDYFEIFLSRMAMCKSAAKCLNCTFNLVINETLLG